MSTPALEHVDAARRGVRSVGVRGWISEECESAALERLVRDRPQTAAAAYLAGRAAALDELRRLSGWRRQARATLVPLEVDAGGPDPAFDAVDDADQMARFAPRVLSARELEACRLAASGMNGREIARLWGVNPSVVTVVLRRVGRKLRREDVIAGAGRRSRSA